VHLERARGPRSRAAHENRHQRGASERNRAAQRRNLKRHAPPLRQSIHASCPVRPGEREHTFGIHVLTSLDSDTSEESMPPGLPAISVLFVRNGGKRRDFGHLLCAGKRAEARSICVRLDRTMVKDSVFMYV